MRLTGETKFFMGIILSTIFIVIVAVFFYSRPAKIYTREEIVTQDSYFKGNKEGEIFLVEFSDFQCPACRNYSKVANEISDKYKDRMLFIYRHFPLDQHKYSRQSAIAAEAAGVQGKFWEMHDYLFDNQDYLSDETVREGVKKLNLDMGKFEESLKDKKLAEKVDRDLNEGKKLGINATPTFFLNGRKLELFSVNDLNSEIEKLINKK